MILLLKLSGVAMYCGTQDLKLTPLRAVIANALRGANPADHSCLTLVRLWRALDRETSVKRLVLDTIRCLWSLALEGTDESARKATVAEKKGGISNHCCVPVEYKQPAERHERKHLARASD